MASKQTINRDWYSVSVVSLRRALSLLALVLMAIGGSVAYQRWQEATLEERADQPHQPDADLRYGQPDADLWYGHADPDLRHPDASWAGLPGLRHGQRYPA